MILQNALVYTPRHTFERGTIVIRDGRIVPFAAPEEGEEVLDAEGLYACLLYTSDAADERSGV